MQANAPDVGWERVDECPICQTVQVRFQLMQTPITKMKVGKAVVPLTTPITWSTCQNCGTEYQTIRLDPESLYEYYSSDQYRRLIDSDNQEFRYENNVRYAQHVMDFFKEAEVTASRQLDYGSGTGALLEAVPWDGMGVEISENALLWQEERGLDSYRTLEEVPGDFDLITIIETLEHLPNPVSTLEALLERLTPDGLFFIAVPWGGRHPGDKIQIGHLFSFSLPSLKFIAEKVGIRGTVASEVRYSDIGVALFYLGVKDG